VVNRHAARRQRRGELELRRLVGDDKDGAAKERSSRPRRRSSVASAAASTAAAASVAAAAAAASEAMAPVNRQTTIQRQEFVRGLGGSEVGARISSYSTRRIILGMLTMVFIVPLLDPTVVDTSARYGLAQLETYFRAAEQAATVSVLPQSTVTTLANATDTDAGVLSDTTMLPGLSISSASSAALNELNNDDASMRVTSPYAADLQRGIDDLVAHLGEHLVYLRVNETVHFHDAGFADDLRIIEKRHLITPSCEIVFSVRDLSQRMASFSIVLTILVILVFGIGSWLITLDSHTSLVHPIERMFAIVRLLAANPLDKIVLPTDDGVKHCRETLLLEETLIKVAGLLQLGFGEAGATIIAKNLRLGGARLDPMVPGRRIKAIFGFCDIRDFAAIVECLGPEVMLFVNQISAIVHRSCVRFDGHANKNIGQGFLMVWRLDKYDDDGEEENDEPGRHVSRTSCVNSRKRLSVASVASVAAPVDLAAADGSFSDYSNSSDDGAIDDGGGVVAAKAEETGDQSWVDIGGTDPLTDVKPGDTRDVAGDDDSARSGQVRTYRKPKHFSFSPLKPSSLSSTASSKPMQQQEPQEQLLPPPPPPPPPPPSASPTSSDVAATAGEDGASVHSSEIIDDEEGGNDMWLQFMPSVPTETVDERYTRLLAEHRTFAATQSLAAFLTTIVRLATSERLNVWRTHPNIIDVIPDFDVRMGFGLHCGWAIEGAIGSSEKIDASYLSPNVNIAARVHQATRQYGVSLLITGTVRSLLPRRVQLACRHIDRVLLKGSEMPMNLYSFDTISDFLHVGDVSAGGFGTGADGGIGDGKFDAHAPTDNADVAITIRGDETALLRVRTDQPFDRLSPRNSPATANKQLKFVTRALVLKELLAKSSKATKTRRRQSGDDGDDDGDDGDDDDDREDATTGIDLDCIARNVKASHASISEAVAIDAANTNRGKGFFNGKISAVRSKVGNIMTKAGETMDRFHSSRSKKSRQMDDSEKDSYFDINVTAPTVIPSPRPMQTELTSASPPSAVVASHPMIINSTLSIDTGALQDAETTPRESDIATPHSDLSSEWAPVASPADSTASGHPPLFAGLSRAASPRDSRDEPYVVTSARAALKASVSTPRNLGSAQSRSRGARSSSRPSSPPRSSALFNFNSTPSQSLATSPVSVTTPNTGRSPTTELRALALPSAGVFAPGKMSTKRTRARVFSSTPRMAARRLSATPQTSSVLGLAGKLTTPETASPSSHISSKQSEFASNAGVVHLSEAASLEQERRQQRRVRREFRRSVDFTALKATRVAIEHELRHGSAAAASSSLNAPAGGGSVAPPSSPYVRTRKASIAGRARVRTRRNAKAAHVQLLESTATQVRASTEMIADAILELQNGIPGGFVRTFNKATQAYVRGNWPRARRYLERCHHLAPRDEPCGVLYAVIQEHDFVAPADWKGYRSLRSK
jgi:hypothetical protein